MGSCCCSQQLVLLLLTHSATCQCCCAAEAPVTTFSWAQISIAGAQQNLPSRYYLPINRSCKDACAGYNLAPVAADALGTNALCRFTNPSTKEVIYGTWTPSFLPQEIRSACRGYSVALGANVIAFEPLYPYQPSTYQCGCCGTINKIGRKFTTGCGDVIAYVPSNSKCPGQVAWTQPAGGQICRTMGNVTRGQPTLFGTIVQTQLPVAPTNSKAASGAQPVQPTQTRTGCAVPGAPGGLAATWSRVCYKITSYSGPE